MERAYSSERPAPLRLTGTLRQLAGGEDPPKGRSAAAEDAAVAVSAGLAAAAGRRLRRRIAAVTLVLLAAVPALWLVLENRRLAGNLKRLQAPLTNVPSLLLTLPRDVTTNPTPPSVTVAQNQAWLELNVEVAFDPAFDTYSARLKDAEDRLLWAEDGLEPNLWDVLRLTFPAELLGAGRYFLEVEGRTADHRDEPIGTFVFRVVARRPG